MIRMQIFAKGMMTGFVFLIASVLIAYYYIDKFNKKGEIRSVRPIAGLDALDEAVGRAAEMGRSVHFTHGSGGLGRDSAPQVMAGFAVLDHLIGLIVKKGTRLLVSIGSAQVIPVVEDIIRTAYDKSENPEMYENQEVIFHGTGTSYRSGTLALLMKEKPGANIMMGPFMAESIVVAEGGSRVGAFTVAGTAKITQMPFLIAVSDYCLLGEELFAAGATLSKDTESIAMFGGQDIIKWASLILIIMGATLATAGSDILSNIFGM